MFLNQKNNYPKVQFLIKEKLFMKTFTCQMCNKEQQKEYSRLYIEKLKKSK